MMLAVACTIDFNPLAQALGVVNYGQMTAGGWMYIGKTTATSFEYRETLAIFCLFVTLGPQGIVHGTYLTLMNAGRLYLGIR